MKSNINFVNHKILLLEEIFTIFDHIVSTKRYIILHQKYVLALIYLKSNLAKLKDSQ